MKNNSHPFERAASPTPGSGAGVKAAASVEEVSIATKAAGPEADMDDASRFVAQWSCQAARYRPFRFRISVRPGRKPRFTCRRLRKTGGVSCFHETLSNE